MTRRLALPLVAVSILILVLGCVPRERGATTEIRRRSDTRGDKAPVLPESNPSEKMVIAAVRFDLTNRPDSQDYWTPTSNEAECVAKKTVTSVGAERLSQLGYQPGTPGAGIPDIALTTDERTKVLGAFTECVKTKEAAASLLFGSGRISAASSLCLAKILDRAGLVPQLFESWVFAKPIDPFANGGLLAETLSAGAQVCMDPNDLNWPTLHSPTEDKGLIDADAPGGSRNSNRPDDRREQEEGNP